MSRALDTYPQLNDDEKERFRKACRDEGVDPKDRCPLCRGRRLTTEYRYGYCHVHKSWEVDRPNALEVACHNCRVQWGVILNKPCDGSGDDCG